LAINTHKSYHCCTAITYFLELRVCILPLFHTVPELLNFALTLPPNLAHKFEHAHELSAAIIYHWAGHPSFASKFFLQLWT